jgi:hypothetical protein
VLLLLLPPLQPRCHQAAAATAKLPTAAELPPLQLPLPRLRLKDHSW